MSGCAGWYSPRKSKARCAGTDKPRRTALLFFVLIAGAALPAGALPPSPLPVISRLDTRDPVFRQFIQDVEASRRAVFAARGGLPGEGLFSAEEIARALTIYVYTPREGENIFSISARANVPYAAVATLNRFSGREDLAPGGAVLLPTAAGIFVSETPASGLERLLAAARAEIAAGQGIVLNIPRAGGTERFLFVPGDDFNPTERIFFLNRGFQFPLKDFRITSLYGMRVNPVTGNRAMHRGVDLAAPEGTAVYAVRSGIVSEQGEDPLLGNYIIIRHENNWHSLYGHLSEIATILHQNVQSGILIGRVGSTGQSTGPHLHFELRQSGQNRDPARLLGLFGE